MICVCCHVVVGWNLIHFNLVALLRQIIFLCFALFMFLCYVICLSFEIVLNPISSDDGNNGYFMSAELNLSGEN